MMPPEILRLRLENQALARARFRSAAEVVAWFGAVQAQDYLGSLWALGLRMRSATEAAVESAETRRAIVRTWPMRGTLHFVAAADVRWMTRLLAPRVIERNAARIKREVNVDATVVGRCRDVITRELEGGRRLERGTLYELLESRRIRTGGSRGLHILGWLAMEGTICFAGRSGKQHTFALLDEWIPCATLPERDAALAELAVRYFTSHGPATLKDFAWWGGITFRDARAAADAAAARLAHEVIGGGEYFWGDAQRRPRGTRLPQVKLLPPFDEYTVAYQDRSWLLAGEKRMSSMRILGPVVIVDGYVAGTWKRTFEKESVKVSAKLLRPLTRAEQEAFAAAARALGSFLGRPVKLQSGILKGAG